VIRNGTIVADTRGFPVDDHDGANRNLIEFQRDIGLRQRRTHVRYVRFDPVHACSLNTHLTVHDVQPGRNDPQRRPVTRTARSL
jgi:hypothetical protein